jgi:hypothetical protein
MFPSRPKKKLDAAYFARIWMNWEENTRPCNCSECITRFRHSRHMSLAVGCRQIAAGHNDCARRRRPTHRQSVEKVWETLGPRFIDPGRDELGHCVRVAKVEIAAGCMRLLHLAPRCCAHVGRPHRRTFGVHEKAGSSRRRRDDGRFRKRAT